MDCFSQIWSSLSYLSNHICFNSIQTLADSRIRTQDQDTAFEGNISRQAFHIANTYHSHFLGLKGFDRFIRLFHFPPVTRPIFLIYVRGLTKSSSDLKGLNPGNIIIDYEGRLHIRELLLDEEQDTNANFIACSHGFDAGRAELPGRIPTSRP